MDVFLDNYDGTKVLCGTSLPSILTKFEFDCGSGASGYQVTVKSQQTNSVLKLCSLGILSSCKCAETSFLDADLKDYAPNVQQYQLVAALNGPAVIS